MHIKQIIIQGFKSYKEQTKIDPFSPKHNVIVGRNGSGKSNFFAAIRFVLGDAYTRMEREDRQALLHEGSGSAVMTAYVEVIFSNEDRRFPNQKDEFILRRTIGLKKDEYSMDKKSTTKQEVMDTLETAGFSRSNPYYIVPQGRVTQITNMKDAERLELLKQVAGANSYEDKRKDSLKIMTDTTSQTARIDNLLADIQERIDDLEQDKELLRQYQEKEKQRKCLQYVIYYREQAKYTEKLEEIEQALEDGKENAEAYQERLSEVEEEVESIDREIRHLQQEMESLQADKVQLDDERKAAERVRVGLEGEVRRLADGQDAAKKSGSRRREEQRQLDASIKQYQKELQKLRPSYAKTQKQETFTRSKWEEATAEQRRLYAKQGRTAQFKSKAERDKWLKQAISDVHQTSAQRKAILMDQNEGIATLESNKQKLEGDITNLETFFNERNANIQACYAESQEARHKRHALEDQKKVFLRDGNDVEKSMRKVQDDLNQAEQNLSHMMDRNMRNGLSAVRRITRQHNIQGVHGILADLIKVKDEYKTAVENTAGGSLFDFVVENQATADKVISILQKEKLGRATFMPLDRLRNRPAQIPQGDDAVPMMDTLEYLPKYKKAVEHVFGRTIICPDLQFAAQYNRTHSVNAITADGDRVHRGGHVSGGYHDPRKSRLDAVQEVTRCRAELESLQQRFDEFRREREVKEQEITRALGEERKLEQKRMQLENSYATNQQELRSKQAELGICVGSLEAAQSSVAKLEDALREAQAEESAFEAEISSDFKKALSAEEERRLEQLTSSVQEYGKEFTKAKIAREELEDNVRSLEQRLSASVRRAGELKEEEFENEGSGSGSDSKLQEKEYDLDRAAEAVQDVIKRLEKLRQSMNQATSKISSLEDEKNRKRDELENISGDFLKDSKQKESWMRKRTEYAGYVARAAREIRDIGMLPDNAHEKYMKWDTERASKQHRKVIEDLKKFTGVNQKSFDQYERFTKERSVLTTRRKDLESSQKAIEQLIDALDRDKDEAIERTFKGVSKSFHDIFRKLVPAGQGRLIIQRRSDGRGRNEDEDSEDEEARRNSVENYVGVGISVSFNSKHDDQQRIQQLSGGQKSLCALALIFAIQQTSDTPFYLFDEIDANLDAQYRTSVAGVLQNLSQKGQFICTTFRPEMVQVAEKCYGVTFSNKTSSIDVVGREEALGFVEDQRQ